jgi:CHAT domain-containing protein/tetratricopeptide (TPR) repeat protein
MSGTALAPRTCPRLALWAWCLVAPALPAVAAGAEPVKPPLTREQQDKLNERGRYAAEAIRLARQGKLAEASAALQKGLAIERQVFGDASNGVGEWLERLAGMCERRDDFAAAAAMRRELLAIRSKLHGEKHWKTTDARLALADVERLGRMTAEQRRRLADARRLHHQVVALHRQGRDREAVERARQVLEIRKEALGEEHPDYAAGLNSLGLVYWSMGDYARAEPLYRQALQIRKQALGEDHPDCATSLNNLAALYWSMGDYTRAEPLYRQALRIMKEALGEKHSSYAAGLNSLALLYKSLGDYARAEPLYRQALRIRKEALGEQHPLYATSLNNLAGLYDYMGDYARAEPLLRQALQIRKQALGEKHPSYAISLNNLGVLYKSLGDYAKAESLCRQALEIRKQALGEQHPSYATSLNNLALLYDSMGDHARAEPLYRQALQIRKQALGEDHPDYATSLNNLAVLYWSLGDHAKAEPLLRQALRIRKEALGEQHPDYAATLNILAGLCWSTTDFARAERLLRQAVEISRANLELAAAAQSQREQLAMLGDLRHYLDAYLSLAAQAQPDPAAQYRPVLAWKGAVARRQGSQRLARNQPELAQDFAGLDRLSARLAALALATPEPKQIEARRRQIQELTEQKEELERALSRKSVAFRQEQAARHLGPKELQAALPADAALIDFLEYSHRSPTPGKKGKKGGWQSERRLTAFVVRRYSLVRIDLGPAGPLGEALQRWRLALQRRFRTEGDVQLAAEVRRLVWRPLEPHVSGARLVLVSPDGALTRVPLVALPGSKKGSYLLEDLALAVVPVPQLLPELLVPRPGARQPEPSLVLVGDVRYDAAGGNAAAVADSRTAPRRGANGLFHWSALPNTGAEVAAIAAAFRRQNVRAAVRLLQQGQATEAAVRQAAPAHRYLHFATHGYFAPKELRSALADVSHGQVPVASNLFERRGVAGFHPGLLSGLVLAGANRPVDPGNDDGILTALEVEAMDLSAVELAVLSACETGLGEEAGGEGLLGLQRAFQLAGARAVVAGLWQVDDAATRKLMTAFYRNLWEKKLPRLEALRQAQLRMLQEGDAWMQEEGIERGMVDVRVPRERLPIEDGRLAPYYWAAFSLSGDWR